MCLRSHRSLSYFEGTTDPCHVFKVHRSLSYFEGTTGHCHVIKESQVPVIF